MKTVTLMFDQEWDELVKRTYKRPYCFQQQCGCRDRGVLELTIPDTGDDYPNDEVPEIVNHDEMGVSFAAWLKRDPKTPLVSTSDDYAIKIWWDRNFYPDIQMVANDLHARGLLPTGDYAIVIDW